MITGAGLAHLKGMTKLHELDVSFVQLDDAALANLAGMTEMRDLNLLGCKIGDMGAGHLKGMTKLTALNLSNNAGITDAAADVFTGMTELHAAVPRGDANRR